jgi:hypothetical protein
MWRTICIDAKGAIMADKPDPKRVAERLAGGSTLRKNVVDTNAGGGWMICSNNIDCPFCGMPNTIIQDVDEEEKVTCRSCQKEFRILAQEERHVDMDEASQEAVKALMKSGNLPRLLSKVPGTKDGYSMGFSMGSHSNTGEDEE